MTKTPELAAIASETPELAAIASETPTRAVRTLSETDAVRVIEGRIAFGGPFGGRDSYGTTFSARTDWSLDLHPAGIPVLLNHGFDPDFGLSPVGRTNPTAAFRQEADGIWVQIQLDKRHRYYETRIKPLLDADALGLSQGSAEHSVRIDERTGEVLAWPLHEISLTPVESNPWSIVAARSAETLRIVAARTEPGAPAEVAEEVPAAIDPSATRVGKRNSARDQAHIDAIHEAVTALGPTSHANDQTAEPAEVVARSGDTRSALRIVAGPVTVDPEAVRAYATKVGEEVAIRFVESLRT